VKTILLVEDEEQVGTIVRLILSRKGYRVLFARSAREALNIWTAMADEIDLLMTDVTLPDGSGLALAQHIRDQKDIRVLVASGNIHPNLPPGFRSLEKPFDISLLLAEIQTAIGTGSTP
jgi:DNA-binding response OmpR family regulator